jgi:hypothetical protein
MPKYIIPKLYQLNELPEFKRFQQANPGKYLSEGNAAMMFGRAIHWLSIYEILWPDFENKNHYSIEVGYIVCNDPDTKTPGLPIEFYRQIAEILAMFWRIQLEDLYPNGDWSVEIQDDDEMTVEAMIKQR